MIDRLRAPHNDKEKGASAVEFALLVVIIALIMVVGGFLLGNALNGRLDESANCVADAGAGSTDCGGAAPAE